MSERIVVYVMSHPAHLPYLAVSLMTLREYWRGHILVYAWPESFPIVRSMADDERLGIEPVVWDHHRRGRNAQFESKQLAMMDLPGFMIGLYLDADTTIHGSIDPLFDAVEGSVGFVATQFNAWTVSGGVPTNRIKRLERFPEIDQSLVSGVLEGGWPSVNGGVFACRPESPVLPLWHEWTNIARSVYISDETVLHTLLPKFVPTGEMVVALGGRWNCSPMRFQPKGLRDEDVVIRHYHGDSNVRPNKSKKGVRLWRPLYRKAMEENFGNIREWRPGVVSKYLDKLEKGRSND